MKPGTALLALTFRRHTATILLVVGWTLMLLGLAPIFRPLPIPLLLTVPMPAVAQWLVVVAQVSFPGSDLTAAGSGYPEFLLRLPITTRSLALWPMLTTMAASLGLWLALAFGYFARVGLHTPVWTICGIISSTLAAIFLISYRPFSIGVFRFIWICASFVAIIGAEVWLHPPVWIYLCLTAVMVWASVGSAGLARQNVSIAARPSRLRGDDRSRPFSSHAQAMFWMDWKLRGRPFPFTVAVFAVVASIPLVFMTNVPGELGPDVKVNGWIPLGLPVLLMGTVAISLLMQPDATMTRQDRSTFFMTLPVTDSEILRSKRSEQSAGVAISVGVVWVVVFGWLLLPPAPALAVLQSAPSQVLAGCLEGLLLVGLMWRSRTIWTFAAVCADASRSRLISLGAIVLPVLMALPVGIAEGIGVTLDSVLPFVPWVLAALVAIRSWMAYRIVRGLAADVRRVFAGWLIAAGLLWSVFLALIWLQPLGLWPLVGHPAVVSFLAALTAVPVVRPLLARRFLYDLRHG